jgi:hypothetical protein
MKLLTQRDRAALPKLYAQDGKGKQSIAFVKFFHPMSRYTFYVTEFDGEDTLYGWCVSPLGPDCDEWGYASFAELAALRVHGLGIERDLHFAPMTVGRAIAEQA